MHATKDQIKQISVLTKRADFLYMNKAAKRWTSHGLVVQVNDRNDGDDTIRLGITITKKIFKSAVKRNRIKRRLRAIAYEILSTRAKKGCDYVLIGRTATLDRPHETLKQDLVWCLKKMDVTQDT